MTILSILLASLVLGPPPARVFICQGSASYAYHATERCESLAWCTRTVVALSKPAAVKKGRRPCGRCYAR